MGVGATSRRGILALGLAAALLAGGGEKAAGARERRAIQVVAPPEPQHRCARPASPARRRCTAPKPLVVVDPGHGGRDPGAVGVRAERGPVSGRGVGHRGGLLRP